jgi:hypothetical protein
VLAYVTNRAIQQRLDDVFGIFGWKNDFMPAPDGGVMCGISVKFGNDWVTKYDAAPNTDVEAVKGGISNAMKRSAVQWGIGRYLYRLESNFAKCSIEKKDGWVYAKTKDGKALYWEIPTLPKWALPKEDETKSVAAYGEHGKGEDAQANEEQPKKTSEDVIKQIRKLITETKADEKKLLAFAKADTLENITEESAKAVLFNLEKKAAQCKVN